MHEDQQVQSREQQLGGYQLTQDISRQFGMPLEEAVAKKSGGLPENYHADVLQPFNEGSLIVSRSSFSSPPRNSAKLTTFCWRGGCAMLDGPRRNGG